MSISIIFCHFSQAFACLHFFAVCQVVCRWQRSWNINRRAIGFATQGSIRLLPNATISLQFSTTQFVHVYSTSKSVCLKAIHTHSSLDIHRMWQHVQIASESAQPRFSVENKSAPFLLPCLSLSFSLSPLVLGAIREWSRCLSECVHRTKKKNKLARCAQDSVNNYEFFHTYNNHFFTESRFFVSDFSFRLCILCTYLVCATECVCVSCLKLWCVCDLWDRDDYNTTFCGKWSWNAFACVAAWLRRHQQMWRWRRWWRAFTR